MTSSLNRVARWDLSAAQSAMNRALAEGTRDARLFWHAGEIALSPGASAEAVTFFARACPCLQRFLRPEARA